MNCKKKQLPKKLEGKRGLVVRRTQKAGNEEYAGKVPASMKTFDAYQAFWLSEHISYLSRKCIDDKQKNLYVTFVLMDDKQQLLRGFNKLDNATEFYRSEGRGCQRGRWRLSFSEERCNSRKVQGFRVSYPLKC